MYEERTVVIWGATYPELSRGYTETVCTGAVPLDGRGLMRLYPLDFRYRDDIEGRLQKWDIVRLRVGKRGQDPRPESYHIEPGSAIQKEGKVGTADGWAERRRLMVRDEYIVESVGELLRRGQRNEQSLALLKPAELLEVKLERPPREQKQEHARKYRAIVSQRDLWDIGKKPVPLPAYWPRIRFRGNGDAEPSSMRVYDWETVQFIQRELHEHQLTPNEIESRFQQHFRQIFADDHNSYLILGNIRGHFHVFIIVGVFYPKLTQATDRQLGLFD